MIRIDCAWLAVQPLDMRAGSGRDYVADIDAALDALAAELEVHVDLDALLAIAGVG